MQAEVFWAERNGAEAYALAAMGKADEARVSLRARRARLAQAIEPPEGPQNPALETNEAKQYRFMKLNYRARTAAQANPILDHWESMMELRIKASNGQGQDVAKTIGAKAPAVDWALADLLATLAKQDIPSASAAASLAQSLKTSLDAHPVIPEAGAAELLDNLPEAETVDRQPPYREAKRPLLAFTGSYSDESAEGYRVSEPNEANVSTVRYRCRRCTAVVVEEIALLSAADAARRAGKAGLMILDRRRTSHTTVMTQYGRPIRSDPDGYECELDVIFVDPAALPEGYKAAPWKVIDAKAVHDTLGPIYLTSSPAG
jgi:hypothetical protein